MTPPPNPGQPKLDAALASLAAGGKVGSGRFTLVRLLGRGGMGVIWLARDEHLREEVALKFLPPDIRHDAVALDDLRRETSRSRKLTHPSIIRIHDLYKSEDEAFISMEFVEGANLNELRLERPNRVFDWAFVEPIVRQLCGALDYAHAERVIHRDLKPANMMLDRRNRLKLADFGLSATVSDSLSRVSMGNHAFSGTASYMSPQQLDGQMPQVTDDIYSLGATLYELLTSRAPFFTGDIAHQVRSVLPQPLEKRLAQMGIPNSVPPAVIATIMACLAKEPERRPQTARAVAEQMGLALPRETDPTQSTPQSAATVPPPAPAAPEPRTEVIPAPAVSGGGKSRRTAGIIATVAALGLVAAGAWWWSQRQKPAGVVVAPVTNVVVKPEVPKVETPKPPPAPEFVSLFNGRDLSDWDGDPNIWTVEKGVIIAKRATTAERRPKGIFWRGGSVEDFELRVSFKVEGGNTGIYYRAAKRAGHEVGGYQFEISGERTGLIIESGYENTRRDLSRRGAVVTANYNTAEKKDVLTTLKLLPNPGVFRTNEWNEAVVIVRGNHVIHELNGRTTAETFDEFKDRPRSGFVALEVYGRDPTTVRFRDIRLKRLPAQTP
jgi:hypothetical protein